jgi:RNA polymerase sigma-70 factor, ECF subfamily
MHRTEIEPASAGPWLWRVARNICIERLRQRARRPTVALTFDMPSAPMPDPVELGEELRRALRQIPDAYSDLIVWRDLCGLSLIECSALSGIHVGTVKSRLHRGRARIAQIVGT